MRRNHQFTLVELLVVIGIIVILAAMLFAGLGGASGRAEKTKAKAQIVELRNAIAAFEMEYNKLPKPKNDSDNKKYNGKALSGKEYEWLILTLQGESIPSDEVKYGKLNTRGKKFLGAQGNSDGRFKDPWDQDFNVIFEASYNGDISNADGDIPGLNAATIRQNVLIWSIGSDGAATTGTGENKFSADNNEDNVYSVDTSWSPKAGHSIQK